MTGPFSGKTAQFDLFAEAGADAHQPSGRRATRMPVSDEDMVQRLLASGRYRILRRLEPRPVCPRPRPGFPLTGVIVDTETTGLNHRKDEIIEIGLIAFSFDADGMIGDVTGSYGGLQQPGIAIPGEITRLTGITDATVAGAAIDLDAVQRLIEPADLVIAHNASFDRPFCEALLPLFAQKAWACSVREVDWAARGFEGTKLGYLVGQSGYFHEGHRAVDDCQALLEVLCGASATGRASAFAELWQASHRADIRLFAEAAPFDMKDHLKARGYRWSDGSDGKPKCWWTDIAEAALADELHYLRTDIYRWPDADPPLRRMTALDRYRN